MENDRRSIRNLIKKIKSRTRHFGSNRPRNQIFVIMVIFGVALASFGVGRLSVLSGLNNDVQIQFPPYLSSSDSTIPIQAGAFFAETGETTKNGQFVASRNGSKYYAVWCGGVSRIKESNKIYFNSESSARGAGYGPAANCAGVGE
ncbi:MAG: hypothetical protein OEX08_02330 [Candidatus Nomurabacteria bacterium]|nr:hypothetical protein [Candidatus Nomurabacteria bacterium]